MLKRKGARPVLRLVPARAVVICSTPPIHHATSTTITTPLYYSATCLTTTTICPTPVEPNRAASSIPIDPLLRTSVAKWREKGGGGGEGARRRLCVELGCVAVRPKQKTRLHSATLRHYSQYTDCTGVF